MMPSANVADAWHAFDPTACPVCGRDGCEDHLPPEADANERPDPNTATLRADALVDAVDVAREGRQIEAAGIQYIVDGVIPAYGMLGHLVAYAKVGKSTFGQALGAAVAKGAPFLDRDTRQARVLAICAEDPPEYTAWLARHLDVSRGQMTFYRESVRLDAEGLAQISGAVQQQHFGFVLISSWQAVVRGLIRDENDNAGAVRVVEDVKAATRVTGVPWLIDAHSGKGEDQNDDADPSRAIRGASGAAGSADYTLSLRYANGAFGTERRISGKGRFVSLEPTTIAYDLNAGTYAAIGSTKNAAADAIYQQILTTGALDGTPRSAGDIAKAAGFAGTDGKVERTKKRQVAIALANRETVLRSEELLNGKKSYLYRVGEAGPQ
jgi:hypothetical protein